MRFLGLASRNVARRRARTVLTLLGIAVAVGSFVALIGLPGGVERALSNHYAQRGTDIVAVRARTVEILTATVDEGLAEGLRRVEGVAAVAGELADLVELQNGENILVVGWPEGSFLWETVRLHAGRLPFANEPDGVLLGEAVAATLHATIGSRVVIGNHGFVVTGLTRSANAMAGRLVAVHLKTLQKLLDRKGKVTVFNIRVRPDGDGNAVSTTVARLGAAYPGLKFTGAHDFAKQLGPLRLLRSMLWAVTVVALLMAVVLVLNTLLMSITERKREIGVLSAVGWSSARIVTMIMTEGLILASVGGLLGLALGVLALRTLARAPQLTGFMDAQIDLPALRDTLTAILLLGVVGSICPAWQAARQSAVDALRSW